MFKAVVIVICACLAWGTNNNSCPHAKGWFIVFGSIQAIHAMHHYASLFLRIHRPRKMNAEDDTIWRYPSRPTAPCPLSSCRWDSGALTARVCEGTTRCSSGFPAARRAFSFPSSSVRHSLLRIQDLELL